MIEGGGGSTALAVPTPALPGVEFTATSVSVSEGTGEDDWRGALEMASNVESFGQTTASAAAWWLGDLLCYGEHAFGKTRAYEIAQEATGRSRDGLRQLSSVSGRVPPENRNPALSWNHHREVAPHGPEQVEWLARAQEEGWSTRDLDRAMSTQYKPPELIDPEAGLPSGIDPGEFEPEPSYDTGGGEIEPYGELVRGEIVPELGFGDETPSYDAGGLAPDRRSILAFAPVRVDLEINGFVYCMRVGETLTYEGHSIKVQAVVSDSDT